MPIAKFLNKAIFGLEYEVALTIGGVGKEVTILRKIAAMKNPSPRQISAEQK